MSSVEFYAHVGLILKIQFKASVFKPIQHFYNQTNWNAIYMGSLFPNENVPNIDNANTNYINDFF